MLYQLSTYTYSYKCAGKIIHCPLRLSVMSHSPRNSFSSAFDRHSYSTVSSFFIGPYVWPKNFPCPFALFYRFLARFQDFIIRILCFGHENIILLLSTTWIPIVRLSLHSIWPSSGSVSYSKFSTFLKRTIFNFRHRSTSVLGYQIFGFYTLCRGLRVFNDWLVDYSASR